MPYLPRIGGRSQFDFRRLFVTYHFRAVKQVFRAYTAERPGRAPSRSDPDSFLTPSLSDPALPRSRWLLGAGQRRDPSALRGPFDYGPRDSALRIGDAEPVELRP